jgi:hemerythrin
MARLQWSEGMSVGVHTLDADHRCLVRIINLLEDVHPNDCRSVIETVLETLLVYGRFHFAREERLMRESGFPGAEFHRSEHQAFARDIEALRLSCPRRPTVETTRQLLDYLTAWLRHHILIQDVAFKPYGSPYGDGEPDDRSAVCRISPPPVANRLAATG